jgi:excisionase family DNA binding protein
MTTTPLTSLNDPEKLLLTRKQAAAALSVGERTLWAMTWPRGPIRSVRIGRSVRYSADALRAWVESQQEVRDQ